MLLPADAPVRIRPARTTDARGVAAILLDLGWFRAMPTDIAVAARQVESKVPDPEDLARTMVVAEGPLGEVAGYAHWTVTYPVFLDGPSLYLTELFVAADQRGRGVGSALLDHLHDHATAIGAARVELLQHRDRDAYRRGFYTRHGYTEAEVFAVLRRTREAE